ncbi:MAG: hypothetical protein WBB28_25350 [Crinalium sp.]
MKRIVLGAILTIATTPVFLLLNQPVQAQINYCDSSQTNNAGNHQNAYADGYREGQQSARDRQTYRPRTAGGNFDRGFYDGYYNRPYRDGRYLSRECDRQVETNRRRNSDDSWRRRDRNSNDTRRQRDRNNARRQRNSDDSRWQRDRR